MSEYQRKCPVTKGQPVSMTERGWKKVCAKTRNEALEVRKKSGGKNATVYQQFRIDSKCVDCDQTVPAEVTFITIENRKIIAPEPPAAYQPMRPVKPKAHAAAPVVHPSQVAKPAQKKVVEPQNAKAGNRKPGRPAIPKPSSAAENDRRIFLRNGCKWMTICALTRAFNQRFAERHSEIDVARMLIDWQVLCKSVPSVSRRKGGRAK